MKLNLRVADGSDADVISQATGLKCLDKTRTKQEFAEECDINTIINRFGLGYEPPVNLHVPMQGDFTEALDFRESLDLVRAADAAFMEMSAEVRKRFDHDPVKFVEFFSQAANREEGVKLGLVMPAPVPEPEKVMKVEVVQAPPKAP